MTSTMGSHTGLSRRLPPMPDENQKAQEQKVNRRNIILVRINSQDALFAGTEPIDVSQLKDKIKIFLTNPTNLPNLPEKKMEDIKGLGEKRLVSQGVISLQNDRGTSYQAYIAVQNELVKAVNELRDEAAMAEFGRTFFALNEDQQDIIKAMVPQQISEAEPKDVTKKRR
jgi:biopolymer transport protein ExbD